MGRPIVYCADCGKSLPETEFDQGRAHTFENRPYCSACRPLPAEPPPLPSATPRRPIGAKTARVPLADPPKRAPVALWAGGGAAALLVVVAVAVISAPSRPPAEPPSPPPPPAPKPVVKINKEEDAPRPPPDAAKLDGFLAEIRKIMTGEDLLTRKGEVDSMLKSALEVAGARKREVEDLRAEIGRRILQADLRAALAGHWPFDATLGATAADATGKNQPARLEKGPAWVDGQVGGGLRFDGADDYVEIPGNPALDKLQVNSYSMSAWFRPEREPPGKDRAYNAQYGVILKEGQHEGLAYTNGGRFNFSHWLAGNKNASAPADPGKHPPGRFYHVAGVADRDAGQTRLYVDGKLEKMTEFPPKTAGKDYGKNPWRIGIGRPGQKDYGWPAHGILDDVRLFNRALTEAEVKFLFEEGSVGRSP